MNYYIDESCHLLNDDSNYMVLGVLFCEKQKEIKQKTPHFLPK